MLYLLIFYWAFSALFCFGAEYAPAKIKRRNFFGVVLECIFLGGIFFPLFLGKSMHLERYIKRNK